MKCFYFDFDEKRRTDSSQSSLASGFSQHFQCERGLDLDQSHETIFEAHSTSKSNSLIIDTYYASIILTLNFALEMSKCS